MAQKKPIIFDFDGPLLDVSRRHWQVYAEVAEQLGGIPLKKDMYWGLKRQNTPWVEILAKSMISAEKTKNFLNIFVANIEQPENLAKDNLFPGASEALDTLAKTYRLYLLSLRRSDEGLKQQLKRLGIIDKFHMVLSGHTDSEGYKKKIELFERVPNYTQAVVVGDTEADILAAKQCELTAIAVSYGIRNRDFLVQLEPDVILNSITELPEYLSTI